MEKKDIERLELFIEDGQVVCINAYDEHGNPAIIRVTGQTFQDAEKVFENLTEDDIR